MANPYTSGSSEVDTGGGTPVASVIEGVFAGVGMAVGQVADIVNNHADRLAQNACAWRNDIDTVRRDVRNKTATLYALANNVRTAGSLAVGDCIARSGIHVPGVRWAPWAPMPLWQYMDAAGIPTGPFGVFAPLGEPSNANSGTRIMDGVYLKANKLQGSRVRHVWGQWRSIAIMEAQPAIFPIWPGGWRGLLGELTGFGAPAWRQGDPVAETSKLGTLVTRMDVLDTMYADAANACLMWEESSDYGAGTYGNKEQEENGFGNFGLVDTGSSETEIEINPMLLLAAGAILLLGKRK